MVVGANGAIRYTESGFMGHLNAAHSCGLMRKIGAEF